MNILRAMKHEKLFAPAFQPLESWWQWRVVLAALFALPNPTPIQRRLFTECTGRTVWPKEPFREAALIVGRRGGKSKILALIAVYLAACRNHKPYLTAGETGVIAIIAAKREQARVILKYCAGLLRSSDILEKEIEDELTEVLRLKNGTQIEIHTGTIASPRGRTFIAVLADEIAFWASDTSANPDKDVITAVRPGLMTIPTSMLLMASSPYSKRGVLYNTHSQYFGKNDAPVLVWKAPTQTMNPRADLAFIEREYENDPANAAAEYGAEFRSDVDAFVAREVVDACTVPGRHELPPMEGARYSAFVDPSGGSSDSMTLAIAHREGDAGILDVLLEARPPFSPESVVREFSEALQRYGIGSVTGDRYGGEWPRERFKEHGITYVPSEKPKSDLYREVLPLLNAHKVELLNLPKLQAQLCGLERRTARGGRDSIDHAPGAHDDIANVVAGVLVSVAGKADALAVWAKLVA